MCWFLASSNSWRSSAIAATRSIPAARLRTRSSPRRTASWSSMTTRRTGFLMPPEWRRAGAPAMGSRPDLLRLDQSALDRVAGELDPIAHAELLEDVGSVALHGLLADDQRLGDLVV